jgi:DNA end-binding protein Ku
MTRALWKGAIAFGLVHIPVALYSGSRNDAIDFDWLDKRDMKPVGYKRINKQTGKEVAQDDIVRGFRYAAERYVVLSDEEIKAANVKRTQSVDILAFVDVEEIPRLYFETPYYLAPIQRGQKVYALLRETLRRSNKVGIANVVIQTKQHLAALMVSGPVLILNTLRWPSEVRSLDELKLPDEGLKAAGVRPQEVAMATQLVSDMTQKWNPAQYHDSFRDDVMAQVKRKIKGENTQSVATIRAGETQQASNVIDLTALLQRSLRDAGKTEHIDAKARGGAERKKPAAVRASPGVRTPSGKRKQA